ncbi:hypothetical protein L3Q82_020344, partial [Scortum barcoo]
MSLLKPHAALLSLHILLKPRVRNVSKEDEATYFCLNGGSYSQSSGKGVFLAVKDRNQQKSVIVKQSPETASVQPGGSVTLQCSLLSKNKENRVQCPGEHSVYWFRAGSGGLHPGIIYTHRNSSDEEEERSCVYSLSKTIQNSSDTGTYYCAVATCGEILFGEGTTVETRTVCDSGSEMDPVVLVLGVLLACCVTVIRRPYFLLYIEGKLVNIAKNGEEEAMNYAALDFNARKVKRGKKKSEDATRISIWVKFLTITTITGFSDDLVEAADVPSQISLTEVELGDNVTFQCQVSGDENRLFNWYKQSVGYMAQTVASGAYNNLKPIGQFDNPRFKVHKMNNQYFLNISNVNRDDEATYFCQSGAEFSQDFICGVFLSVKDLVEMSEVPPQISLTEVELGDNVTFQCRVSQDQNIYFNWYKQSVGYVAQTVARGVYGTINLIGQFDNPRFKVHKVNDQYFLNISNVNKDDEATYFCQSGAELLQEINSGVFLSVKDCKQQKYLYVKQTPETASVQPGGSVTLQCSLLSKNKENRVQCPGEHSVYWFRAGSGGLHPGVIYTHRNSSDEEEERSCVYSLSKTIQNSSDTGTYYCAVATCGEILFGEGTTVEANLIQTAEIPPQIPLTVAEVGDNVTLQCSVSDVEGKFFYWYKQSVGYEVQTVARGVYGKLNLIGQFENPRFKVHKVNNQYFLNISNVNKDDEATYFCQSGSEFLQDFIPGVFLVVKAKSRDSISPAGRLSDSPVFTSLQEQRKQRSSVQVNTVCTGSELDQEDFIQALFTLTGTAVMKKRKEVVSTVCPKLYRTPLILGLTTVLWPHVERSLFGEGTTVET